MIGNSLKMKNNLNEVNDENKKRNPITDIQDSINILKSRNAPKVLTETTLRDIEKYIKNLDEDKKDFPIDVDSDRCYDDPNYFIFTFKVHGENKGIRVKLRVYGLKDR